MRERERRTVRQRRKYRGKMKQTERGGKGGRRGGGGGRAENYVILYSLLVNKNGLSYFYFPSISTIPLSSLISIGLPYVSVFKFFPSILVCTMKTVTLLSYTKH